ncbi:MAG: alkaline phosphatase [Pseudomonadales bacterium]|nr:alkaline phosphatase [Pseudomonadales bacterium]
MPITKSLRIIKAAANCSIIALLLSPAGIVTAAERTPRLILQITVDALRGDLPERYAHLFGKGGFRYLMEQGVCYTNAHYQHANTETIVGHASLATGTVPAAHGMVGNIWFDREKDRIVYNIEDANYHLLSANADVNSDTELDPTQKAATVEGRSPNAIMASTFSDELAIHSGGKSKIFAVSVKDRGAIPLAGHTGKAFWFSKANGEFVSSSFYYDQYPQWVKDWNARNPAQAYSGKAWQLMYEPSKYLFGARDDQPYETDFPGYGRVFPHPYGNAEDNKYFTTFLTLSPAGDELTLDFAKALIDNEQLGQDDIPDYLAVSFSSTDYIGHLFGASSLETEDNMARLDRTLAELFRHINTKVGLKNTLIVLSADHGQPEVPGHLNELGIRHARYFDTQKLDKAPAIAAIKKRFGIGEELIDTFSQPYVYLNRELIHKKGLNQAEVEEAIASELVKFDGIAAAVSSTAMRTASLPDTLLMRSVLNNFYSERSGDIYVVFEPNIFISDFDGLTVASTHGSPWRYDTYVPVMFAGAGLDEKRVSRPITPYDIAPTLANYLGIKPPSGTIGNPLVEVVDK